MLSWWQVQFSFVDVMPHVFFEWLCSYYCWASKSFDVLERSASLELKQYGLYSWDKTVYWSGDIFEKRKILSFVLHLFGLLKRFLKWPILCFLLSYLTDKIMIRLFVYFQQNKEHLPRNIQYFKSAVHSQMTCW